MNLMDANIPEEIQEKLKIIEMEAGFSQKMLPPQKKQLFLGIVFILLAIVFSINDKNYYELAFFLLVGLIFIANYFEYKQFYKQHSNARDIIKYYQNRESNKT